MNRLFTLAALLTAGVACQATDSGAVSVLADVLATCAAAYSVAAGGAHDEDTMLYVHSCLDKNYPDASELCDAATWLTADEALCVAEGIGFPVLDTSDVSMYAEPREYIWVVLTPSAEHAGFVDRFEINVHGEVLGWTSEQEATDDCRAVADC
jgi:hypothetical protein